MSESDPSEEEESDRTVKPFKHRTMWSYLCLSLPILTTSRSDCSMPSQSCLVLILRSRRASVYAVISNRRYTHLRRSSSSLGTGITRWRRADCTAWPDAVSIFLAICLLRQAAHASDSGVRRGAGGAATRSHRCQRELVVGGGACRRAGGAD